MHPNPHPRTQPHTTHTPTTTPAVQGNKRTGPQCGEPVRDKRQPRPRGSRSAPVASSRRELRAPYPATAHAWTHRGTSSCGRRHAPSRSQPAPQRLPRSSCPSSFHVVEKGAGATNTSPQVGGSTRGHPDRATTPETTNQVDARDSNPGVCPPSATPSTTYARGSTAAPSTPSSAFNDLYAGVNNRSISVKLHTHLVAFLRGHGCLPYGPFVLVHHKSPVPHSRGFSHPCSPHLGVSDPNGVEPAYLHQSVMFNWPGSCSATRG